ncbi:putative Choline dehydrogenase [Burkholderiales bacterium 8X]|nr:putative Choline dehydrogenase [Burkholderiales bacterium 8X]
MSGPAGRWLAVGAEVLVRKVEASAGEVFDCDLLIVGSGYGGAVAAARFAGLQVADAGGTLRPAKVYVLERGVEYLPGDFPDRFADVSGHVRFSTQDGSPARGRAEALFDVRIGTHAHVLVGNGLGGGSLINAGVMERPTDEIMATKWPSTLDRQALEQGYAAAEAMLAPQRLPDDTRLLKLDALERLAASEPHGNARRCSIAVNFVTGHRTPAGVEMARCTLCGDCVSGCNQRAKLTLDTNYLAFAKQRGAELYCGGTVERIAEVEQGDASHWRVDWHFTEASRRPVDGRPFRIRAARVVLAAGALGSTEILLRSEKADGGTEGEFLFSGRLGKQFSTNGDMIAAVTGQREEVNGCGDENDDPAEPGSRRVGPTITGLVRPEAEGMPFAVQEFGIPAALRRLFGEVITTGKLLNLDLSGAPTDNDDPMAVTKKVLTHTGVYGLMGDDGANGKLALAKPEGARDDDIAPPFCDGQVAVQWKEVDRLPLFKKQFEWLERAGSQGTGGKALPNPLWKPLGMSPFFENKVSGVVATVHPLGGCAMGETAAQGAVDVHGRVFRRDGSIHRGLAVLDGAIVPRSLAINPALTITALAEQACRALRVHWGFSEEATAPAPVVPRPLRARRAVRSAGKTGLVLVEHFQGPLELGGVRYWASLHLRTVEIADLTTFVRRLPRKVDLHKADLMLTPVDASHDEFSEPPPIGPNSICAGLSGQVGLFEPQGLLVARELRYALEIRSLGGAHAHSGLRIGTSIDGRKRIDALRTDLSPWCELTQLSIELSGLARGEDRPPPTVWQLDLARMARYGRLMLSLTRQANAPEALADLAALALMVLRVLLVNGRLLSFDAGSQDMPSRVGERYPGPLPGFDSEIVWVHPAIGEKGARLTHYRGGPNAAGSRPVLMIHGFGASGSTFAHPSIPNNLALFMLTRGRDVWVLDLRTSIANVTDGEGGRLGALCNFEDVALGDIPKALQIVQERSDGRRVDVVAHCIGSAMFCVAALESARPGRARAGDAADPGFAMRSTIGAVVLSQVGPLVELSPMNQLRGFVASYIEQFLSVDMFDTRPEPSTRQKLLDMVLAFFPYPPDDREEERARTTPHDFRWVRHRADAIFGQLMELANVGDDTLMALDAIYGWVKVRALAQTIHFARHRMLTDASGRNAALVRQFFEQGFDFPLLMVHGRRNRVFDWRGSLESLRLLAKLRQHGSAEATPPPPPTQVDEGDAIRWSVDGATQLLVVKKYGHQDCVIGHEAHADVFPAMHAFLERHATHEEPEPPKGAGEEPPRTLVTCETPWIGPSLGWTRFETEDVLEISLLVHASPRHARTLGVVFVPVFKVAPDRWEAVLGLAAGLLTDDITGAPGAPPPDKNLSGQAEALAPASNQLLKHPVVVGIRRSRLDGELHHVAVLTVHSDLPLSPDALFREKDSGGGGPGMAGPWLQGGRKLGNLVEAAVLDFFSDVYPDDARVEASIMSLEPEVVAGADLVRAPQPGEHVVPPAGLRFALGSCQYPRGMLDEACAEAAYRQLGIDLQGRRPQFLVLAGDQVYLDATAGLFDPAPSDSSLRVDKAYELNLRLPSFRRVAARLPIYTMLDDHEVHDDWQPDADPAPGDEVAQALAGYETYQAKVQPRALFKGSRHYRFDPGGYPFFVLDTRSERERRRVDGRADAPDAGQDASHPLEAARIVSDRSMARLQDWLGALPAASVKFVVSPTPVLPFERFDDASAAGERLPERLRSDGWSGYPHSLCALLEYIEARSIQRVVFLSGDAHLSLATKLLLGGGTNAIYSVVSSGLYAPWPFANGQPEDFALAGAVTLPMHSAAFGTMHTAPLPPSSAYALIGIEPGKGGAERLVVDFRPVDGPAKRCTHDLSLPASDWQT